MEKSTKESPITYDISTGEKLILQKDSEQLIFNRSPLGLYFHDAGACDIIMVEMTKENCKGYNRQ